MLSLVQVSNGMDRRVAIADGDTLRVVPGARSIYDLAFAAWDAGALLGDFAVKEPAEFTLDYGEVYRSASPWRLMVPFDHPLEPARCLVSGTGLTHMASAEARQKMHSAGEETDSIRMYRMGEEGGRPAPAEVGTSPEWFYKGNGTILKAHGEPLEIPSYAADGGEEAEVVGIYLIDHVGRPRRLGFAAGNEFSDHRIEKRNYLYLAHSKLRECSLGPELAVSGDFQHIPGTVRILRAGQVLWEKQIASGERNMCHSLPNIEHHHFKYALHRRPGDVHIHFYGADALSCSAGVALQDGDVAEVSFPALGRPLRNPIRACGEKEELVAVYPA